MQQADLRKPKNIKEKNKTNKKNLPAKQDLAYKRAKDLST